MVRNFLIDPRLELFDKEIGVSVKPRVVQAIGGGRGGGAARPARFGVSVFA
jgi:hypothetical protein